MAALSTEQAVEKAKKLLRQEGYLVGKVQETYTRNQNQTLFVKIAVTRSMVLVGGREVKVVRVDMKTGSCRVSKSQQPTD